MTVGRVRPEERLRSVEVLREEFRRLMSRYFTGVTVVTSNDGEGKPHGLTCNSLTSVTLTPPTLLVCLNLCSGTLAAIRHSRGFVVNLLHDRARTTAKLFSSAAENRFRRVSWTSSPVLGLPWLDADAHSIAECRVTDTHVVGDHAIVYGEVTEVTMVEDTSCHPLLYGMRKFFDAPESVSATRKEDAVLANGHGSTG